MSKMRHCYFVKIMQVLHILRRAFGSVKLGGLLHYENPGEGWNCTIRSILWGLRRLKVLTKCGARGANVAIWGSYGIFAWDSLMICCDYRPLGQEMRKDKHYLR